MPISAEHAGRTYAPTAPYEVASAKIAEFAAALGDENPAYRGPHPIAPPTFAAVIAAQAWESMFADAELGLALQRVVHSDSRFVHHRALRAGDRVQARLTISRVRRRGAVDVITSLVSIQTLDDEPVCDAEATFFHTSASQEEPS